MPRQRKMDNLRLCVLTVLASIASHVVVVECCSCRAPDPFDEICSRDLAIRAKVVSVTYPNGLPEDENELYDVRHELEIQEVIASPDETEAVPDVLETFGPGHLCGLELRTGYTYILAGNIRNDSMNPGKQVLAMFLCHLHILIGGAWGISEGEADELVDMVNCSNPARFYTAENPFLRRTVYETQLGKQHNEEAAPVKKTLTPKDSNDPFKAFINRINQRELASGIESFLSAASGSIRKRMARRLPL
ncbi:uncharacterized protein LOC123554224 [Mercenaria mercenaria]|uniref:uncharacterized protein LOC123554224 n=1 Tax=Mercenaria mercenaria TaxID=6596 RepID=UPI00234EE8A4|nr:uncharacterized protein LOC123554224 [Mercenaria mercenaria]